MGLLDQNYQDQRLKKKVKPAIQGGGPNYLGKEEEVTVPKRWLSDPDHVVAELAYITPREKKILLDIDLYGSLNGTPNSGPGGIPSLQGDMGSVGGGNNNGGNNNGGGGGRQDTESQYGGDYSYDSSQNVSDRDQQYGGGSTNDRPTIADVTGDTLPGSYGAVDPDPEIDTPTSERQDTITSFSKNLQANIRANPFSILTPTSTLLGTALQTAKARSLMGLGFNLSTGYGGDGGGDDVNFGGDGDLSREQVNELVSYAPYLMSDTVAPESMISEYFSNMPLNSISSNLQTDYNNAKNSINSILGITPVSQQFGYSTQPYGSTNGTNLMNNLLNIDYLRTQGLI
jgi:hypothetical protein